MKLLRKIWRIAVRFLSAVFLSRDSAFFIGFIIAVAWVFWGWDTRLGSPDFWRRMANIVGRYFE